MYHRRWLLNVCAYGNRYIVARKHVLNKEHALNSKCALNRKGLDIEGGVIYCKHSKVSRSSKNDDRLSY